MSWFLAFAGFAVLIVLHEFGHFIAAKAVGMRVERFGLFFPPFIVKRQIGETEYGIGAIPLGGFVKITGMNPEEELPPDVAPRAYYHQPVWKRIVVIGAGPSMNLLIAFLILFALAFGANEPHVAGGRRPHPGLRRRGSCSPATASSRWTVCAGDQADLARQISKHRCPGDPRPGCLARTPAVVQVERDGQV